MPIEAGATYVFDKGYMDYAWWHEIHQKDAFFVTRLKKNSKSITVEDRTKASSQECAPILSDKVVRLATQRIGGGKPNPFMSNQSEKSGYNVITTKDQSVLRPMTSSQRHSTFLLITRLAGE